MLATGGCGRVYLHTTNPVIATGDGVAMASRAGAEIGNMEFIQFHPTTLYHPDARSFLISEAVRGEGGILRLANGDTFMENYHQMGCLAPRDIVARAIDAELKKSGDECVYLDVTHLDAQCLKSRFPNIYKKCLSVGIDITKELIPIVPAAHYSCGGVRTNLMAESSIDHLYACGEVACTGVHGANRLASNSLLEALVFAHRAAEDAERHMSGWACDSLVDYDKSGHVNHVKHDIITELADKVHRLMWRYVGIVRTNERLDKAREELDAIAADVEKLYTTGRLTAELLELRSTVTVAGLIIDSAISRKESRGLNYNLDYPQADDANCKKDTVLVSCKS
jgi:L-aspartate oxidase